MRPHVTPTIGDPELMTKVLADHLEKHFGVDPKAEWPFVVSSTPILNGPLSGLRVIQMIVLVTHD